MPGPVSTMMTCSECQLSGGPFASDEAELHVTTHNRLHHRCAPVSASVMWAGADLAAA